MTLDTDDQLPEGISLKDAYAAVRAWYQANVDRLATEGQHGSYPAAAKAYVESLPAPDDASESVMRDCLREVLSGELEFGYHDSDGKYKMAAYAHAAFDAACEDPFAT